MKITILTLFPEMFRGPFDESILKHAKAKGLLTIEFINIRDFGIGKHQMVDDTLYGGGVGMLMRVDVLHQAIEAAKDQAIPDTERKIIMTSAHGQQFNQRKANDFARLKQLIIVCGHYEGVDSRIRRYIDEEISIGDFVTTGGEIPAMLITDAISRRIPGVLKDDATLNESFQGERSLLEHEQFTKPPIYDGVAVPDVLISGHHKKISEWKEESALKETKEKRPDLLKEE